MRTVILTVVLGVVIVAAAGLGFAYSGLYTVSATEPHWPITRFAPELVRDRSIKVPPGLSDHPMVVAGVGHFAARCASCHGAPGVPPAEFSGGLYPEPPDLRHTANHHTPAELFWILQNGIKMSGMPSWSDHGDQELWATVAFLEKLPGMTEDEYRSLVVESLAQGGGHPHGAGGSPPRRRILIGTNPLTSTLRLA